jgi:hypothetical protein
MEVVLVAPLLVLAVGSLVLIGLSLRDFVARGTGSRRELLIFRQRLSLVSVLSAPLVLFALLVLDLNPGRAWWIFALAGLGAITHARTTVELRRLDDE